MKTLSIIIPAHDNEATLRDALISAEASAFDLRNRVRGSDWDVEFVIVDDGSTDETLRIALEIARDQPQFRVLRRARGSSPGCARNTGAAASRGDILFFLDADDRFRSDHLHVCQEALLDPSVDFVKTDVELSDPVHPDWAARIANSLVLNLAVRRSCHEAAGGFPDFHLTRRATNGPGPSLDVFRMIEDVFYNELLTSSFRGRRVEQKTVVYRRHPGNSFDRQYARFQKAPGTVPDPPDEEFDFRVKLAQIILAREKRRIAAVK